MIQRSILIAGRRAVAWTKYQSKLHLTHPKENLTVIISTGYTLTNYEKFIKSEKSIGATACRGLTLDFTDYV